MWIWWIHYKETVAELTETCPNHGVLNYKKLIENCPKWQKVDQKMFELTVICPKWQKSVNFLSIFCSLGHLDSDMFCQFGHCSDWIVFVGEGTIGVGVWWGAPIIHRMSGLSRAWHWHLVCGMYSSWASRGQFVLGYCCWCYLRLLMCNIYCVYWLVMFGWWGVPHCCDGLFSSLSNMGAHRLIVGEAMCLCHFCGTWYSLDFGIWEAGRCSFCGYPCIERIKILEFG
jgi:hypothetical protein